MMMQYPANFRLTLVPILLILIVLLVGCTSPETRKIENDADIISMSHSAAKKLILQSGERLGPEAIIVASFASIDNLEKSSSFGRIVSQQFASEFSNNGYTIIEMLLRNNVYIARGEGEFLLSRSIQALSMEHNAQAVIVGTYAIGANNVYVTSKVIRASDSMVLASYDFSLPLGPDTDRMLRK
jgi:TolB-like protein